MAAAAAVETKPIDQMTTEELRALYDVPPQLTANPNIGEVTDRTIPGPGGKLPIRIYRPVDVGPASTEGTQTPGLMFFHGGGWVVSTIDTHDVVCRALCEATAATVVSVGYRLAPEHPFPAAADDCTAATKWVSDNGSSIGVDSSRLALCGDSAGGNLVAVVALDCADGPKISAQALVYPAVDATREEIGSLIECAEGYMFTTEELGWYYNEYATDPSDFSNPRFSPLLGDLAGQPPAIVITAQYDPLRDEGKDYAEALKAAGGDVEYFQSDGQIHGFFKQVGVCDASQQSVDKIASFITARW